MHKQLLFLIAILLSTFLKAQEVPEALSERKNAIGISIGLLQGFLEDQNFSLLQFTEIGWATHLKYIRENPNKKNRIEAQLYYTQGKVKTSINESWISLYQIGDFEFTWLRKLNRSNENRIFYLGGFYQFNFNYYEYLEQSTYSFLVAHNLGVKGQMDYRFNDKQKIKASLAIPLFSNMIRPPFVGFDKDLEEKLLNTFRLVTEGYPTSLNKYIALNLDVDYLHQLSERWILILSYEFYYQRLAERNPFIQVQNQYRIGLNFKL